MTWEPAPLSEVVELFSAVRAPWWIAGGYAIELAVGRAFREHADVDVLLLRRDQLGQRGGEYERLERLIQVFGGPE
ncbi:hypothetical protein [Amycolatopsis sp. NPDC051371]|uniref:nucleotidyltransferase domain-containing protein n=1 Tax=Amycolatopsis sp. NPDC051371 TaxID=3155800 RepID=UPI003429098A